MLYAPPRHARQGAREPHDRRGAQPEDPALPLDLGVAHYLRGQHEEALTEFLQSTVIDEAFVDGFIALGALHRRLGDPEASQAALERAVKAGPRQRRRPRRARRERLPREGRRGGARALREGARRSSRARRPPSVNLALLAWEAGNLDAARKELERALAAEPSHPEALNDLAILDGARGAADAAAERFRRALDAGAPRAAVLYNLGTLQLQAGQLADAEATLPARARPRRRSTSPPAPTSASSGCCAGSAAEAARDARRGARGVAGRGAASYNLALAHQLQRGNQQALVHYLRALQARRDLLAGPRQPRHPLRGDGAAGEGAHRVPEGPERRGRPPSSTPTSARSTPSAATRSMAEETIRKTTLVDPNLPAAWHALATSLERKDPAGAAEAWRQFLEAVRRDRNRAFWVAASPRSGLAGASARR